MNGRNFELRPHRRKSLTKRILGQVLRLVLIGAFFYITYLGFTWRKFPEPTQPSATPPAGQVSPPAPSSR